MARTPSTPPASGMLTSMTTTSGPRARTRSSASSPFSASPTTLMSSWALIRPASALRKRGWSSTTSTRSGGGVCSTRLLLLELDNDTGSRARCSVHLERTADLLHALPHGCQAEAVVERVGETRRIEAGAIVRHLERHDAAVLAQAHVRMVGAGVLPDVRERLLHD